MKPKNPIVPECLKSMHRHILKTHSQNKMQEDTELVIMGEYNDVQDGLFVCYRHNLKDLDKMENISENDFSLSDMINCLLGIETGKLDMEKSTEKYEPRSKSCKCIYSFSFKALHLEFYYYKIHMIS